MRGGTDLEVCALLQPAGGRRDLYEVLRLDDGRLLVAVGDVRQGNPRRLFMASPPRCCERWPASAAAREILGQDNDALAVHNPRGMFVTLLCMIIDPQTGKLTCANAGHPPPVLVRPGAKPQVTLEPTGMVSGIMAGTEIGSERMTLEPQDTMVLYTDGVTEAFNAQEMMFDEPRLLDCLGDAAGQPAEKVASTVLGAVRCHAAGCPQSDDITVVAVRRAG